MREVKPIWKKSTSEPGSLSPSATAALLVALLLAACGGAPQTSASTEPQPRRTRSARLGRRAGAPRQVPVRPIEIVVQPKRSGGSLEVAIQVIGRGHSEGEAFEDLAEWNIVVRDHRGQELRRIMNGPGRVERDPVGEEDGSQWDVRVHGTVFFALPKDVSRVAVRVAVPEAQPVEIESEVR
jgi:hypothetical protein